MIDQKGVCQEVNIALILMVRSECMLYIFYSVVKIFKTFLKPQNFFVGSTRE